jgi:hypothetical protein
MAAGETWWPTLVEDVISKVEAGLTDDSEAIRDYGEAYHEALRNHEAAVRPAPEMAEE